MDTKKYFLLAVGFVALLWFPKMPCSSLRKLKTTPCRKKTEYSVLMSERSHFSKPGEFYGGIIKDYVHTPNKTFSRGRNRSGKLILVSNSNLHPQAEQNHT